MSPPVVSVLLPARNASATVERAARSILGQSLGRLELLAIDDGSSDGTSEVLRRLAAEDGRVRLLEAGGRGLVHALTLGLGEARAPYVARMDADDESHPDRLALSVRALEADPTLGAVGTQVEIFREDRPVSPKMRLYEAWLNSLTTPEKLFTDRFVESPLCHPSTTARKEALRQVGAWEDGDFPEDYQLWLKLLHAGWRLRAVEGPLFRWRDGDGRLTRKDPRYALERYLFLKARFLALGLASEPRRVAVWGAGQTGLSLMRFLRAEGVEVALLVEVSRKKVGQRIDGIPVIAPDALPPPSELHLIAAVGAKGAREEIRGFLRARGWSEGRDFTCAA
ncbi:MAG TPA: glycosyltransferase [Myxococcaceae bacterium]|nr:glycosyltransferase [Myxococcaceae bacterium]